MSRQTKGGFLIAKIHFLAGRIFAKMLKEHHLGEINPAQGRILFALWQNNDISIQELAKETSLGKSTLTSMLDRLEAAGYLARVPSKDDRRKTLIRVLKEAPGFREAYTRVSEEMSRLFYGGFTDDEIDSFETYLYRILTNLTANSAQPGLVRGEQESLSGVFAGADAMPGGGLGSPHVGHRPTL